MNIDEVSFVVKDIEELPYKVILIDGEWGIGKTYAIEQSCRLNKVSKISMFGITEVNQIYHEVIVQIGLNGVDGKKIDTLLQTLSWAFDKDGKVKELLGKVVTEKDILINWGKSITTPYVIIIDDLERMSVGIDFEEVLGIIETLKQCIYLKIILIANINAFTDANRKIFDQYSEKIIDRIYHITDISQNVEWKKLGIHSEFITKFLQEHSAKNLRTIIKAQNFFEDVKRYCQDIKNEEFINEIRMICYAIVVENIDQIYFKMPTNKDENDFANLIDIRLNHYLKGIKCSSRIVSLILQYYKNEIIISKDQLKAEYKNFLKAGNKPNFFKSDDEMCNALPTLANEISNADNIASLNAAMDEYACWGKVLDKDIDPILQIYENKLEEKIDKLIENGNINILSYDVNLFDLSSLIVRKKYNEIILNKRETLIKKYIKDLQILSFGIRAYESAYQLKYLYQNTYYKEIIDNFIDGLYRKEFFPMGQVDRERYIICSNIMFILYHNNSERFLQYCEEIQSECDKMSVHRIEVIVEELLKGY